VVSVKSARVDGARAVLALRGGGELVCDAALIVEVRPDEAPWPEPEPPIVTADAGDARSGAPFADLIGPLARHFGVDPSLVHAVVSAESGYEPAARSRKGALGLMQLMPATARQYGVSDPFDPQANLEAGIRHLRSLLDRYDVGLALAAYNAGEGAVRRYGGIPPYSETRAYVRRVLSNVTKGPQVRSKTDRAAPTPTRTRAPRS
jgi:soluble lytic murein transglycosylase-like protein